MLGTRKVYIEMEGPRHEIDRVVKALFEEMERMMLEVRMSTPLRPGHYNVIPQGHHITGHLVVREDLHAAD